MRTRTGLFIGWTAAVAWLSCLATTAAGAGGLIADCLRCEYLRDPLGVEDPSPRLSWVVSSTRRSEFQSAYQVLVASSPERLAHDDGDLWDSGKIASPDTCQIPYRGQALLPRAACYWKVRSWDRDGDAGSWSTPAHWEMGLLSPTEWSARWIDAGPVRRPVTVTKATYYTVDGAVRKDVTEIVARRAAEGPAAFAASNEVLGGDPARNVPKRLRVEYVVEGATLVADVAEHASVNLARSRLPYLRERFPVRGDVRSARLFATALGVYELRLNGSRVGDRFMAPGWTDYAKRVRYQVYDVTAQLRSGDNVLGAIVGPGWYCGHAGLFGAYQFYGKTPALCAQLEITYADGHVERIVTDPTWTLHEGPILSADLLQGETYDARSEVSGWDAPGFDDSAWAHATAREESRTRQSDVSEPIRALAELPARSMSEPAPGRWTFDLGQNMVGVVRLRLSGAAGTVVTIRHAEVLNPDGTVYTANLRGAAATDTYICKGGGVEVWQPRFTLHGFRYVEVTGLRGPLALDTVTGIVLGSDLPTSGEFSCSDPRLNQLQSNIAWGLRGNYVSIPTDCPQRDERMGWMADAQVFLPTAAYNADVAAFMSKWMVDVIDAQRADGAHSDVAPAMKGLSYGTPAWGDAGVIVPWTLYQMYGDTRVLGRSVDSMKNWVDWCRRNSTGLIRDHARGNDYGDWLSIDADTPKDLIGTAYFAHSTQLVAKTLAVLGRENEAAAYRQLFDEIRGAFVARFVTSEGRVLGGTQCGYVLALEFGLMPDALRPAAAGFLEADIRAKDWHLSTGFVGISHLLQALTHVGRADVAHRLLMQDSMPSWLFSVKHGATTIWERWNGWTPEGGPHPDAGMNSFNHYALGSCGRWLYESVAGIAGDPEAPGFSRIIIRPRPGPSLTSARARHRSIRGDIAVEWTSQDRLLRLRVSIPANTTATVYVPSTGRAGVRESGALLEAATGVRFVRQEPDATVLSIGSGSYTFTAPLEPAETPAGAPNAVGR